jgi:hypothetical protein
MDLLKKCNKAVDKEIREEAREEAKEILRLTTEGMQLEFLYYYNKDQGNICCLVLDKAKQYLIMERKMILNKEDHFGHQLFEDYDTIRQK